MKRTAIVLISMSSAMVVQRALHGDGKKKAMRLRFISTWAVLMLLAVLSCAFCTSGQAQTNDKRLMTDAEYKTFLHQVDAALPKWETDLKNIALEKVPQISYSTGKLIVDQRDICLMQIGYIRDRVAKQTVKRTVSGELALFNHIQSLRTTWETIVMLEATNDLTLTHLEKYLPEFSELEIRIGNDVIARVDQLEKNSCP